MRSAKIIVLALLLSFGIYLSNSDYRNIIFSQIRQLQPTSEYNVWDGNIGNKICYPSENIDSQLLRKYPKDFYLRLALVMKCNDKQAEADAYNKLVYDFPNEPTAYSWALNSAANHIYYYNRIEALGVSLETAKAWKKTMPVKPLTPDKRHKTLDNLKLLEKVIAIDPENGFFYYRKAALLFALNRDSEAINCIHKASQAKKYTCYDDAPVKAIARYQALSHDKNIVGRLYSQFYGLTTERNTARIIRHIAFMGIKNGNKAKGINLTLDNAKIARMMVLDSTNPITALVGVADADIGLTALDPMAEILDYGYKPKTPQEAALHNKHMKLNTLKKRNTRIFGFLRSQGYTKEADMLSKQIANNRLIARTISRSNISGQVASKELTFISGFHNGARIAWLILIFVALWIISLLLGFRRNLVNFWDRRAAVTSVLLGILPLAMLLEVGVELVVAPDRSMGFLMTAFASAVDTGASNAMTELFHVGVSSTACVMKSLFWAILGISLLAGLIIMLRRPAQPGKPKAFPAISLIVSYISLFGLVIAGTYLTNTSTCEVTNSLSNAILLAGPLALIIYGIFRAIWCKLSTAKQPLISTFIATVQGGAKSCILTYLVLYILTIPITSIALDQSIQAIEKAPAMHQQIIRSLAK